MANEHFVLQRLREEIDELISTYGFDPFNEDDSDIWLSALEGETSIEEVMNRLLDLKYKALANAEACKLRIADLKVRGDRYEYQSEMMVKAMEKVMRMANLTTLKTSEATFSIRKGTTRVEIEDEAAIPQQLMNTKTTVTPDKAAIKKQLDAGEIVPGAVLVTGPETLSIRTK